MFLHQSSFLKINPTSELFMITRQLLGFLCYNDQILGGRTVTKSSGEKKNTSLLNVSTLVGLVQTEVIMNCYMLYIENESVNTLIT